MAGTNVPSVSWGPNGFQAPSGPAVLAGVQADLNAAFGGTLNYQLTTPQGQLASSEAAIIDDANSIFVYYTQQVDPAYASGRMQDAIGRIYFMERNPSQPTVLQVACVGLAGVSIPVDALIQDASGNTYTCTQAGVISLSGTITLSFANLVPGPIAVPGANAVSIYKAVPGWDSVTVVSGVLGNDVETRSAFENRRRAEVAKNSVGSLASILGKVLDVPGVIDAYVTENDTNAPAVIGGVTLAANSVYAAAVGGTAQAIAVAIWSKKAPGCSYNGNTTVTVYDQNPAYNPPFPSYQVKFEVPTALAILFSIKLTNSAQVPANAVTLIQNAIIAAFAGEDGGPREKIGGVVYHSRFYAPIFALGSWATQVIEIQVGSTNDADAVSFAGSISGTTLTVSEVISGALATGQTISDLTGAVVVGTMILSGSGTSWTVSNSQTVAGASFTGTGSGTNLTASAVTGTIAVGAVVVGSGVPSNTVILSQTSGTPGGAGVYVTSYSTTSSGASLTANELMGAAVANQDKVQVNIDQVPTVAAADIQVTLV